MSLDVRTEPRVTRAQDPNVRDTTQAPGSRGEFGKVLNARPTEGAQRNANERAAGWKVLENALQKQYAGVGPGATLRRYEPSLKGLQKTVDGMKAGWQEQSHDPVLQATREQFEANAESNVKYLELQRQFQDMNRQFSCLSNLMKARNDSVKASVAEIK